MLIMLFKASELVLFCFSGPTILFFQENAGSILIVIIMATKILGDLHWIAYVILYLSIGTLSWFYFIFD